MTMTIAPPDASMTTGPSAPPAELCPDLGLVAPATSERTERPSDVPPGTANGPATSTKRGSYNYDREHGGYPLEWSDFDAFNAWRREEELRYSIELTASTVKRGGPLWTEKRLYVCSRQLSGGRKQYQKKNPDQHRKIGSKKTGCGCRVVIKLYPHTDAILGNYTDTHDHDVGSDNIAYTRMSGVAREQIRSMLVQRVDRKEIIRAVHDSAPDGSRDKFIAPADVSRMGRAVEQQAIRLHPQDAISVRLWIDRFKDSNTLVFYKDRLDQPPLGSQLEQDSFVLCIQARYQLDAFRRLGNRFIGIDATHNVTAYPGFLLFTIIARDNWGHGVPVAWMLASNGTTATIAFFLSWVRDASPSVQPSVIMTDRDQAQINALAAVYPQSTVNLCTWHVLRAMRSHFNTNQYPILWDKVKAWVKTTDQIEFARLWVEISGDPSAPQSFIAYLKSQWLTITPKWSKVLRKGRSIYEEGDTNMLIEAYHHVLKTHWLDGKRQRRIDHVIVTLVQGMVPLYENRHERQNVGLDGKDLAAERRQELLERAAEIPSDSIQKFDDTQFHVASKSRPGLYHAVDLHRSTCECEDFPRIRFCRHIAAVLLHFPGLSPQEINSRSSPESSPQSCPQRVHGHRPVDTLQVLTQDISSLSQTLAAMQAAQLAESAQSTAVIEAARSAKYSLTTAIAATQGSAPLPNRDVIARNHKSWTETAKQMGVAKKATKRARPAEDRGLTERSIGVVKGKRRRIHNDPYAGGERSGKRAKPDPPSTVNAPLPTVASTSGITLPGPAIALPARATVPPPTSAPGNAPPAQALACAPPPTRAPGFAPPGLAIPPRSQAFAFAAAAPPL